MTKEKGKKSGILNCFGEFFLRSFFFTWFGQVRRLKDSTHPHTRCKWRKKEKKKKPAANSICDHKSHKLPTYCQVFGEGFGAQKLVSNQASNKQVCLVLSEKNAKALLVSSLSVSCLWNWSTYEPSFYSQVYSIHSKQELGGQSQKSNTQTIKLIF
jgi:hypothetical protein